MHRQLHLIILTVLMAALLAGCGGNKQDDNEDLPEARPLLEEGASYLQDAQSFELEMDVSGYPVNIKTDKLEPSDDEPLLFKYARGVFQAPDRIDANIEFGVGEFSTTAQLVALDREHYFRGQLLGNRWIRGELIEGFSPASLIAQPGGIPYALLSISNLTMQGRTDLDGLPVFHLSGTIQANNVHSLTFGLIRTQQGTINIEVYIQVKDRRVVQIRLIDPPPVQAEDEEPTSWQITFAGYNRDVTITPPPLQEEN
ncbi:MAG: LppX_LprAFG lipoprotein [Chloroflexi bacterium]|nr:LppX_LprAFG lipoprotein [Chloroflexota bacterium]